MFYNEKFIQFGKKIMKYSIISSNIYKDVKLDKRGKYFMKILAIFSNNEIKTEKQTV